MYQTRTTLGYEIYCSIRSGSIQICYGIQVSSMQANCLLTGIKTNPLGGGSGSDELDVQARL